MRSHRPRPTRPSAVPGSRRATPSSTPGAGAARRRWAARLSARLGRSRGRLDSFFERLNAGGDPYAWLGNQPSLASPWDYYWLGPPPARRTSSRAPGPSCGDRPRGLPGNDDLGALSAWYVWASIGLYPVTPGTANVVVGVPAFTKVTVRPSTGVVTRILRTGGGARVGGLLVDGAARSASWVDLDPDQRPGRLEVVTTDEGSSWGTGPGDVPPSYPVP